MSEIDKKEKLKDSIESEELFYLRHLEKHLENSVSKKEHSVTRFDILMVSLSILGLGFVTNYAKELKDVDLLLINASQISFVVCLIINVLSQIFGIWSNTIAEKLSRNELYFIRDVYLGKEQDEEKNEQYYREEGKQDFLRKVYDQVIRVLNVLSFITLISGLITFLMFDITP